MLQKFNITTYAVALCLFGFMIFSAAPVFANDEAQGEFEDCKDMKWKDGPQEKKDCFKELAKYLINNDSGGQTTNSGSSTEEPFSEELCDNAERYAFDNPDLLRKMSADDLVEHCRDGDEASCYALISWVCN